MEAMGELPVMLNLRSRRAVVVGGSSVAVRRVASLVRAGADVTVIAPAMDEALEKLPVVLEHRAYAAGDLDGAFLVVIATDSAAVNDQVARDARAAGVLVNRADDPDAGDFIVPAHTSVGPITVAVSTGRISARAAAVIRDQLVAALDPDWPALLTEVEPFRRLIQEREPDARKRQPLLMRLTNDQAMAAYKTGGRPALLDHCRKIADGDNP
jgi:precorrin-2 dehydrogenase/sirohydrochlorin ferrochelatase